MFLTDVMTYLMKGTLTNIKGVLRGDGKILSEVDVDNTPTASSDSLVTSGGVKSAITRLIPGSFELVHNSRAVITLSSYHCALRAFGVLNSHDCIDLFYSYGRKYDGIIGSNITASLSSDYKTLTITNLGSAKFYLGIAFFPATDNQTISVAIEYI